mmetsp:Transcript_23393/g.58507  ORF Transcript_23393/g.58507 Transcript_23393/m.58507 type:complete len:493 (-) Transcript_23393:89-1567(-)|eukprot:CAMPEP_0177657088 /NCGR_PEP_ID=MMETSP0447-20121125/15979_1 /TAXON_ID=0 /ORGANISM="Stygamoeba regulata, Strain BSH-02190019" /LENGTH=492 /DNA_ID=CAMNT_0019161381 /DNA_START=91 /DNA_END=1569 /DNA_ORIENTATION=-
MRALLCVLLLALVLRSPALPAGRTRRSLRTASQAPEDNRFPAQWYEDQMLDHFNALDKRTWRQRYFVNDLYFKPGSSAPVFLCVGGEGPPLTSNSVISSVHCNDAVELAQTVGALMIAVEHRYYGESIPTKSLSTEDLKFLSSRQALNDLALFHGHVCQRFNLTAANKWVSWGGSYPGMLAGWFRLKYPHLVHAAVSSSSPLQAQLDFPEYNDVVGLALKEGDVGGSDECFRRVAEGHADAATLLQTSEGRARIAAMFNICGGASALDVPANARLFGGQGMILVPAQENDPSCTEEVCNIEKICHVMTQDSDATSLARLAKIAALQRGAECVDIDAAAQNAGLLNTTVEGGTDRVWFWQTCTEFGFYQTCEDTPSSMCPYMRGFSSLNDSLELCAQAFGIPASNVADAVERTNTFYGGRRPAGERILFPNGSVDPWHALGVLQAPRRSEPALWVKGASHHFWTHPSKPSDTLAVVQARHIIWKTVLVWLAED